jgi:uncharacterized protein YcbK (DUF882 family)
MKRRDFLLYSAAGLLLPQGLAAFDVDNFLSKIKSDENSTKPKSEPDRRFENISSGGSFGADEKFLWMTRKVSGEEFKEVFFANGKYNFEAYKRFCFIMRDLRADGEVIAIDANLLNVLYKIQNTLLSFGIRKPLNINSGYRSKKTNEVTEGAAKNSFHTKGRAIDISNESIDSGLIGTLGTIMASGGVGFYPSKNFIHLDTGDKRHWIVGEHNDFRMIN